MQRHRAPVVDRDVELVGRSGITRQNLPERAVGRPGAVREVEQLLRRTVALRLGEQPFDVPGEAFVELRRELLVSFREPSQHGLWCRA